MKLPVRAFEARGYRSLKAMAYPVSELDILVGANGVGKVRRVIKLDGATQIEGLKPWGAFGDDEGTEED